VILRRILWRGLSVFRTQCTYSNTNWASMATPCRIQLYWTV